jgi:hypothetical protein
MISPQLVSITSESLIYELLIFWPGSNTIVSDPAGQIGTHDDIAMSAIQTSLAVLQQGSSLAARLPFIAPIAGLILQALNMRDARVAHISPNSSGF